MRHTRAHGNQASHHRARHNIIPGILSNSVAFVVCVFVWDFISFLPGSNWFPYSNKLLCHLRIYFNISPEKAYHHAFIWQNRWTSCNPSPNHETFKQYAIRYSNQSSLRSIKLWENCDFNNTSWWWLDLLSALSPPIFGVGLGIKTCNTQVGHMHLRRRKKK